MAFYKDTYRCQKCGKTFTWCCQAEETEETGRWIASSIPRDCSVVTGLMSVIDNIYEVLVSCPHCGYLNGFNCKIEGMQPNIRRREANSNGTR